MVAITQDPHAAKYSIVSIKYAATVSCMPAGDKAGCLKRNIENDFFSIPSVPKPMAM